jgi:hypothetical protein
MKPPGKECVTIRSALAVVSANPPSAEHDVLRTCLLVGPAVSERLCSRQPWRSAQQWEDAPVQYTIHAITGHILTAGIWDAHEYCLAYVADSLEQWVQVWLEGTGDLHRE